MSEGFQLNEEQQAKAKELLLSNRIKKSCNKCFDRGYDGILSDKSLLPCPKCVDEKAALKAWKEYALTVPELAEYYGDYFKEMEKEEEEAKAEAKAEAKE